MTSLRQERVDGNRCSRAPARALISSVADVCVNCTWPTTWFTEALPLSFFTFPWSVVWSTDTRRLQTSLVTIQYKTVLIMTLSQSSSWVSYSVFSQYCPVKISVCILILLLLLLLSHLQSRREGSAHNHLKFNFPCITKCLPLRWSTEVFTCCSRLKTHWYKRTLHW